MSHWDHRVVRRIYPGALDDEISYEIHEAFLWSW